MADIIKVRSIAIMLSCEKWVEITWLLNTVKGKRARGEASSHCWSASLKGKRRGCARLAGVFYGLLFSGGERWRIRSVELTGTLRDLFNKGDEQLQARDWPFSPCNFHTPSEIWTFKPYSICTLKPSERTHNLLFALGRTLNSVPALVHFTRPYTSNIYLLLSSQQCLYESDESVFYMIPCLPRYWFRWLIFHTEA